MKDNRPSVKLHNAISKTILRRVKIEWEDVEEIRKPVLDYLKLCEYRDKLSPMEVAVRDEGSDLYLMFAIAEDGGEGDGEEAFRSERYPLADVIIRQYLNPKVDDYYDAYVLISGLERALDRVQQKFTEVFGIECSAEAVLAEAKKQLPGEAL